MTTTATATPPVTAADDWNAQFAALKARFPKQKDSIIFCYHALQMNPDIALDDLKAQANMHGIRVTASSVSAGRRLIENSSGGQPEAAPAAGEKPVRERRPRAAQAPLDVEALIRSTVTQIQGKGAVEADRLRVAIRKAIELLQAAAG